MKLFEMMFLAVFDPQWIWITLGFSQFIYNIVSGMFLRRFSAQAKEIAGLKRDLQSQTQEQVSLKFSGLATEIKQSMGNLTQQIAQLNKRVDEGDGDIEKLTDRDHRIEIMLTAQTRDLQEWMHKTFASKDDVGRLDKRLDGLGRRGSHGGL